jgi:hypothetical protein
LRKRTPQRYNNPTSKVKLKIIIVNKFYLKSPFKMGVDDALASDEGFIIGGRNPPPACAGTPFLKGDFAPPLLRRGAGGEAFKSPPLGEGPGRGI